MKIYSNAEELIGVEGLNFHKMKDKFIEPSNNSYEALVITDSVHATVVHFEDIFECSVKGKTINNYKGSVHAYDYNTNETVYAHVVHKGNINTELKTITGYSIIIVLELEDVVDYLEEDYNGK